MASRRLQFASCGGATPRRQPPRRSSGTGRAAYTKDVRPTKDTSSSGHASYEASLIERVLFRTNARRAAIMPRPAEVPCADQNHTAQRPPRRRRGAAGIPRCSPIDLCFFRAYHDRSSLLHRRTYNKQLKSASIRQRVTVVASDGEVRTAQRRPRCGNVRIWSRNSRSGRPHEALRPR
jgi:hypothetical protein